MQSPPNVPAMQVFPSGVNDTAVIISGSEAESRYPNESVKLIEEYVLTSILDREPRCPYNQLRWKCTHKQQTYPEYSTTVTSYPTTPLEKTDHLSDETELKVQNPNA